LNIPSFCSSGIPLPASMIRTLHHSPWASTCSITSISTGLPRPYLNAYARRLWNSTLREASAITMAVSGAEPMCASTSSLTALESRSSLASLSMGTRFTVSRGASPIWLRRRDSSLISEMTSDILSDCTRAERTYRRCRRSSLGSLMSISRKPWMGTLKLATSCVRRTLYIWRLLA